MVKYVISILLLFPFFSYSQGLNNSYDFDQKDIAELFRQEQIEVYKFPITFDKHSTSIFNYVLYYYKDGQLVDSVNYLSALKAQVPPSVNLLPYLPQTEDSGENLFRIYIKYDTGIVNITLRLNGFSTNQTFDFNPKIKGSRAMIEKSVLETDNSPVILKRTRLLTIYGINEGELHCAMEDTNDELKGRMNELIVLYVEPIK